MNNVKNNFNHLMKKSISKQFFLNYFVLFVLIAVIFVATNKIGQIYINSAYDLIDSESYNMKIYKDIDTYGIDAAFEMSNFEEGAYLELLDYNLTVVDSYNSPNSPGYIYVEDEFDTIENTTTGQFDFYYPSDSDEILLIFYPESAFEQNVNKIYWFQILFFVLCLTLVLFFYVKVTAKQIVRPINNLLKGVATISEGKYDNKISFDCNNELYYLKDAINNMAEKIQEEISLREKTEQNRQQLILDISHDLKTPLTNILGYSETLLEDSKLTDAEKSVYLKIISSNSKRANTLIQDLFQLSQMDHEEYSLNTKPEDICEFTRELIISYIPLLREKNMEYHFDIPEEAIMCSINTDKFERAISNLIINSLKYSGENTKLTISISDTNNEVKLIIQDNGIGIDKNLSETIFDPFIRSDAARNSKTGGTGLGLAITKKIIERHGGTITLDTSINQGCKFIITLPKS